MKATTVGSESAMTASGSTATAVTTADRAMVNGPGGVFCGGGSHLGEEDD